MPIPNDTVYPDGVKRCKQCDQVKPATTEFFHYGKLYRGGLRPICIECAKRAYAEIPKDERRARNKRLYQRNVKMYGRGFDNERLREYTRTNSETRRATGRKYYRAHREQILEKERTYRGLARAARPIKCIDPEEAQRKARERHRLYQISHREQILEKERAYVNEHREQKRSALKRYAIKHAEELREYRRLWGREHREKIRASAQVRNARMRDLPATFTEEHWQSSLEYFHGACAYCEHPPSMFDLHSVLHQEHHIPVSKGGGYTPGNILPACQSCNLSKRDHAAYEWLVSRFGPRRAKRILERIEAYFKFIEATNG